MRGFQMALILIFALVIGYSAYGQDTDTQANDVPALVAGNIEFAFKLYQQIASEKDGNLIFSPYSISQAFAMVYAGARGETESQMADTLNFTLPQDQLHAAFQAINFAFPRPPAATAIPMPTSPVFTYSPADELTLNIANSVWGQEGFPFEQAYLNTLETYYGAGLQLADFSTNPEGARETIRQWVEDATEGRITDMPPADAITPQTRFALVNAIYFKGEWTYPFETELTHDAPFHLTDGSQVTVPMMVKGAEMACGRGEDYYAIRFTYGEARSASMFILLPDTGNFANFETALSLELLQGMQPTNSMTFSMPRFDFESEIDLRQTLSAMGMPLPFSAEADFTAISSNNLAIDYASHKATISVDEQGTEAAGVTSTLGLIFSMGIMSSCGDQVTADRPFIFIISDNTTGTVLFMGRVMNPAE